MSSHGGKFKVCRKTNSRFTLTASPVITPDNEYIIVAKDTKLLIYSIKTGFCVSKCRVDFSIKRKTGYIKGFNIIIENQNKRDQMENRMYSTKIIAGYRRGFVVIWDIKNILQPGIENFYTFAHEIDQIVINQSSRNLFMATWDNEVMD